MWIRQRDTLSTMESALSLDPVLAQVAALFAVPATQTELTERPAPTRPAPNRFAGLRRALSSPQFIAVLALTVMVVCAVIGGVLNSAPIALSGLAAPVLLGIGCYFAIKRRKPVRPTGINSSP
jgi:hypothetical protein